MDAPLARGGYSEVWKGKYQGREVAVKVLKVYQTSDFDKIMRVGHRYIWWCKVCVSELIVTPAEVLQGGYDLENPSPRKFVATGGSDDEQ